MRKEISNWWKQALSDFDKAKILFKNNSYDGCAFFCQQASEKGFKALLIHKENDIIKTHDLVFLARRLNAPDNLVEFCKLLTPVYIETRYPGIEGVRKFTKKEVEKDLKSATEILKWIKRNL